MADRRLVGNVASMVAWQAGNYLIPLLTFPYLTRVLHVHSYGEFAFSFGIATYGILITDWGFGMSASGDVAQSGGDRQRITDIFWSTMAAKAILALLCAVALGIAMVAIPSLRALAPVLAAASAMVIGNLLTVYWCLQGLEKLGSFAIVALVCRALVVPATYLLVKGPGDAWLAAAILSGSGVLAGLVSLELLRRQHVVGRPSEARIAILERLRSGWHLFLAAASANLYTTSNIVIVGAVLGPAYAGIYAAADRLRGAAQGVIQPVSQASYPRSCRLMVESRDLGLRFARKVLGVQLALTLAATVVLAAGAPLIIRLLAGPAFAQAVPVLQILSVAPLLIGISDAMGVQILLPLGARKSFSDIRMWAGVINIAAVLAFTATLGVIGSAIGTIGAEIYILAAMVVAVRKRGFRFLGAPQPVATVQA